MPARIVNSLIVLVTTGLVLSSCARLAVPNADKSEQEDRIQMQREFASFVATHEVPLSAVELRAAVDAIHTNYQSGLGVPRLGDPDSLALFDLLVARENVLQYSTLPAAHLAPLLQPTMQAYIDVLAVYRDAHRETKDYDHELVELAGIMLPLQVVADNFLDGLMVLSHQNSSMDTERLDRAALAMREGTVTALEGYITMATERDLYSKAARLRLMRYLAEHIYELVAPLAEEHRQYIITAIDFARSGDIEPEMDTVLERVRNAIQ